MISLIILQFVKLYLLIDLSVFITLKETIFGDIIFDSTDGLVLSPRYLSMFTLSFLSGCSIT